MPSFEFAIVSVMGGEGKKQEAEREREGEETGQNYCQFHQCDTEANLLPFVEYL